MQVKIEKKYYLVLFFATNFIITTLSSFKAAIYADDAAFFSFGTLNMLQVIEGAKNYVPGRNLHMVWQNLAFLISMQEISYNYYHIFQSFIFVFNGLILVIILLKLGVYPFLAYLMACFFIYQPLSTEVLFWASALPMHLFSSMFVLLLVLTALLSYLSPTKIYLYFVIVLLSTLAIYTYDQAATTTLGILGIYVFSHVLKHRKLNIYLVLISSTTAMAFLHYSYLVIRVRPSSSGPVLRDGLLNRILGYASSTALNSIYLLAIVVFFISIVLSTNYLKYGQDRILQRRCYFYYLMIGISAILVIVSFLPAWAWSVSPRHHYLPTVFLTFFLTLTIQNILYLSNNLFHLKYFIYGSAAVVLVFSVWEFNEFRSFWNARNELRAQTYESISNQIQKKNLPRDTCFVFVDFDSAGASPFYSEVPNIAMGIYTNNTQVIGARCLNYGAGPVYKDSTDNCAIVAESRVTSGNEVFIDFPKDKKNNINWQNPTLIQKCL